MLLDPDQLQAVPPSEILNEISRARLDVDHRVLHALLDRPQETIPALVEFTKAGFSDDEPDLTIEAAQLFHALNAKEGIPFLIQSVERDPHEVPDEVMEALHSFGPAAVDPLLDVYKRSKPEDAGEIAFLLSSLRPHDDRILRLLLSRLNESPEDTAFLLGVYGDGAATPQLTALQQSLPQSETQTHKEITKTLRMLADGEEAKGKAAEEDEPFDIYSFYPHHADLPIDLFSEDERVGLFTDERPSIRAAAVGSFFNQHPEPSVSSRLFDLAKTDPDANVRARAWETLMDSTDDDRITSVMLSRLRDESTPPAERGGLLVGLSAETDRNEVRKKMEETYQKEPAIRAKVLEAMWRSLNPAFRDNFSKHLDDEELEVRRSAIWGVGYYAIKGSLDKVRQFFDDETLRTDAIFAYALALPNNLSKGRANSVLKQIARDAGGLSEIEERLAMTALDERLMISGKEPVFFPED